MEMIAPTVMTHVLYVALMVGPTAYVLARAVREPRERAAWTFLGAGLTLWTLGCAWQMAIDLRGQQLPFPSPADALWLSSYLPTLAGMGLLVRARVRRPKLGIALSGLMLASVFVAVVTAPLLPIMQRNASDLSLPAQLATFAYPVTDTVLGAVAVTLTLLLGARAGRTWLLLALGALPLTTCDVLWALHVAEGTWQSLMWSNWFFAAWPVMVAVAARPSPSAETRRAVDSSSVRVVVAVLAASLAAIVLLVLSHWIEVPASSVVLAALGLLAAIDRIWAATAEGLRASRAATHDRTTVEDVRDALADDEITVDFQPLVDARTGAVAGAEALVRWRRGGEIVPPDRFLPAVEGSALIAALTDFVIDRALAELAELRSEGHDIAVSVNLAARNLADPALAWRVGQALRRHGAPAGALTLELTETAAVVDEEMAARVFGDLDALGVTLSLDDFGTGHSSLVRLARTPLDELKIDRSLVGDMSANGRRIVAATVELAHGLGMRVVAEGVETAEALELMRRLGCDLIQGWHIARAMPSPAFRAWLRDWDATHRAARWALPAQAR
jgi:EAL domain-containing protein (putative c-di-GMP-specific phosphodiesterase class I)